MNLSSSRMAVLLAAVIALTLAGCGSGGGNPSDATPGAAKRTANKAFPRTVQTSHGAVKIPASPQRIVVLGAQQAEAVLALGAQPVAIDTGGAAYSPWLKGRTGSAEHQTLSDSKSVKIEAVAADRPDLIIAANWLLAMPGVANKLKAIAPTVDVPDKSINPDWDKVIRSTADALGQSAAGMSLVSSLSKQMANAGKSVPAGTTYNWVRLDANGWGMGNGSLLDSYGLKPAAGQDNSNIKQLSTERTGELTGDALFVWAYGKTATDVMNTPGATQLPAARNGTLKIVDLDFANALNSPGAYGIPWLTKQLRPTLAKLG